MAVKGEFSKLTVEAGADLRSLQYYAIALDDGQRAIHGGEANGILQSKPNTGEPATIGYLGVMKFRAGGAVSKDNWLRVDSNSTFVAAGSGHHLVGRALAAVTSGSIGTGVFNFANPPYAFSSSFLL